MRKYTPKEYEEMVQDSFPHMELRGDYVGLAKRVVMSCSRCGGTFSRIAQSNLSRDCPICFDVYSKLYGGPPGFYGIIEGVSDIRQLGAGNMDDYLEQPATDPVALAKKMSANPWANLMVVKENPFNEKLERALADAMKKHGVE